MNLIADKVCDSELLLQYVIDINWLVNNLSKTKRCEALAYELAVSCMDLYLYKDNELTIEEKEFLITKIKSVSNLLSILQREKNCINIKHEIDRLIEETNLILLIL